MIGDKMKKRIIALILALATLLSILLLASCDASEEEEDSKLDDPYLKLVNKSNPVDESYVPEGLTEIDKSYLAKSKQNDNLKLDSVALEAVKGMLDAMRADGIDNVSITSAYRTYQYQENLFSAYIASERAAHPDWSDEEVKNFVLTYSAAPGTSEHQTGLCVDLITDEMVGLWNYGSETPDNPYDKGFAETAAFDWLKEHAHEYGFILRFPENKTDITGYSYESWHYRYVGIEHAWKMHEEGITLEEYLEGDK